MERQLYRNSPELDPAFTSGDYVENKELREDLKVDEIGLTSAPLKSAAFGMHEYCKDYCQDFMKCRQDEGIEKCLLEGRKVTRCGRDFITKIQNNCSEVFKQHWECLTMNNHQLEKCRAEERSFNKCTSKVFNFEKVIPNAEFQVHLKSDPIYK
eukprot:NODE_580_length_6469_cov_0.200628.p4 type:complete len:154 gc:universal NODE_580_length_6469_cov_0.200628:5599-5138(-)